VIKRPRQKNDKHLDFIRGLPCVVCGNNIETQAAHIRVGSRKAAKRPTGMQEKPDDAWTVPMCGQCHTRQHSGNEIGFWKQIGIDPFRTAAFLWQASGDYERGEQIVQNARM
jgi:hypothetical protein